MTTDHPLHATYRVQLTPTFGFDAAAEVLPHLAALGITHVYLSPVAEAVTGSTHGYDVVDPARVRDELGGRESLLALGRAARALGMGLVIDIVPNHVSTVEPARNPWWWALLRDGATSEQAAWFDVDWSRADGRVIVPVLGAPLADVLAGGELCVEGDVLRYHERTFPLRPDGPAAADGPAGADLVAAQHHRLQFWRDPERNVRRFFTIDDLVAIRPEQAPVADAVHAIVADLVAHDLLDGVRVDHVDGLADPAAYLATLRETVGDGRWIAVEKIVVGPERLPTDWPVDGTTGYEWIRLVDHLFTHPDGEATLTALWRDLTGDDRDYHEHERDGVRSVLEGALSPDLDRVARVAVAEAPEPVELADARAAIVALTVELGRYRTYLTDHGGESAPDGDDALIRSIGDAAAGRAPSDGIAAALPVLVETLLAGGEATVRWQQLTGPALAKGGEDQALYRWFRLAAHNEVGGDPGSWTLSLDAFHEHNAEVAADWPAMLLAGSTHDTKRSEDVRARLLVLPELADRWVELVDRWRRAAGPDSIDGTSVDGAAIDGAAIDGNPVGGAAIDGASMLLAVQTAVGAWTIDADRLGDYLVKAGREAAVRTTWADPDEDHESALRRLADVLTSPPLADEIGEFAAEIDPAARHVALAQLVLRCTAPGVPDVYQGGESWLHTLVDPDNRAPIDPARLSGAARTAAAGGPVWTADRVKAAVLARSLDVRRRHASAFEPGSGYAPLTARGAWADHVVAFRRHSADGEAQVLTVVSRFPRSRPDGWGDTALELPAGTWHDALAADGRSREGSVPLADLLATRPAALLTTTP